MTRTRIVREQPLGFLLNELVKGPRGFRDGFDADPVDQSDDLESPDDLRAGDDRKGLLVSQSFVVAAGSFPIGVKPLLQSRQIDVEFQSNDVSRHLASQP